MDLSRLITLVRAHLWLIIGSTVLAVVAALGVTAVTPKVYEAEASVVVGPGINGKVQDYNQLLSSLQLARTYAAAATTGIMAEDVIRALGLDLTPADFLKTISVSTARDTPIVGITAQSLDPIIAAKTANEVATRLVARAGDIEGTDKDIATIVRSQISGLQALIAETQDRITALQAIADPTSAQIAALSSDQSQLVSLQSSLASLLASTAVGNAGSVAVLDPATPPSQPSSPKLLLNLVIGAVVGLMIGLLAAFALTTLDDSVKSAADVHATLGLPILGVIGRIRSASLGHPRYRLTMLLYPRSVPSEAFRKVRTSLSFSDVDNGLHTIVVTSAGRSEGKTTVASNLALAFAQNGRRTILVDADLRQPMVHDLFGLPNDLGLSGALVNDRVAATKFLAGTEEPNLTVLTAGHPPPNPAELLASKRMARIIESLSAQADIVVIDTPPLLAVTDAAVLASAVDGTILVVSAKRTKRAAARSALTTLQAVGGRVLGVVLVTPKGTKDEETYDAYPYSTPDDGTEAIAQSAT